MRTVRLGSSREKIPVVGFGTWQFNGNDDVISKCLDLGATLIDTAESYNTEHLVGRAIRSRRDEAFIATKVSPQNAHPDDLVHSAEASLKKLQVETIDLYQLHAPNPEVPIEETFGAMANLVQDGVVRHIGVSNFSPYELKQVERFLGKGVLVSNQIKYGLLDHVFGDEVVPYCEANGITVIAYSSLEQGIFRERLSARPNLAPVLEEICRDTGSTIGQLLLAWVVHRSAVVAIPKTNHVSRVEENSAAADFVLTGKQYNAMTEAAGAPDFVEYWWR